MPDQSCAFLQDDFAILLHVLRGARFDFVTGLVLLYIERIRQRCANFRSTVNVGGTFLPLLWFEQSARPSKWGFYATPRLRPSSAIISLARSRSARLCVAVTMARSRAFPSGTVGKPTGGA